MINTVEGATTISAPVAGSSILGKTGAGMLILTGTNTVNVLSGITLNAGSIMAMGDVTLGGTASLLTLNGGTGFQNYISLTGTGTSSVNNYNNNVVINNTVLIINDRGGVGTGSGSGAGIATNFGLLTLNGNLFNMANQQTTSGTASLNFGATTLAGNSTIQSYSGGAAGTNLITLASITGSNTNLAFGGSSPITVTGTVNLGSGTLGKFNSGTVTLTGSVTVGSVNITQENNGNLTLGGTGTSGAAFVGTQTIGVSGGTLQIGGTASASLAGLDRISNTATLTLSGGNLMVTQLTANNTEQVGALGLGAGFSKISGQTATSGGGTSIISFGSLGARATGSTLDFTVFSSTNANGSVQFSTTAPALSGTNGIIGGWATAGDAFATVSSTGTNVVQATPSATFTSTDFSGAGSAANIKETINNGGTVILGADTTVNSLILSNTVTAGGIGTLDLGNHTLVLGTGGLLGVGNSTKPTYSIINGTVTAGTGSAAELFYNANTAQNVNLGATIANNGSGVVSLVLTGAGGANFYLTGANTYTGKTYLESGSTYILTDRQFGASPASFTADSITLSNGAALRFIDNSPAALSSNRGITLAAGGGTIYSPLNSGGFYLAMPISGVGPISFGTVGNSAGRMIISGASTYDGVTSLNNQSSDNANISFTSVGNIGSTTPTSLGTPTTAANGIINLNGNSSTIAFDGAYASITDRMIVSNNTGLFGANGAGALTLNGNFVSSGFYTTQALQFNGYGLAFLNGNILQTNTNATPVSKSGNGTWQFNGENTYAGTTTVTGGVLEFNTIGNIGAGPSSLGAPTTAANGTIILGNGTLRFVGTTAQSTDRGFSLQNNSQPSGIDTTSSAPITFLGGIVNNETTNTTHTVNLGGTGNGFFSGTGIISDNYTNNTTYVTALNMQGIAGQGNWTLSQSASNPYSGTTTVTSGQFTLDFSNMATPTQLVGTNLTLAGGILNIQGKSGQAITENFKALTLNSNTGSQINVNPGNAASSVSMNVGTSITRNGGSTLNINLGTGSTMGILTTSAASTFVSNGIINYATINGTSFATVSGSAVTAGTGTNSASPGTASSAVTGSVTVSSGSSTIAYSGTALTVGQAVTVSATVGTGNGPFLSGGSTYYVVSVGTGTIQLASTPGGTPIAPNAAGTPNVYSFFTSTGTTLTNGQAIALSTATSNLSANRTYYVVNASGSSYQLSDTLGGAPIAPGSTISSVNILSPTFTASGTTPVNGEAVVISASAPTGFSTNTVYYMVNVSGSTYQLASSPGGTPITPTSITTSSLVVTPLSVSAFTAYTGGTNGFISAGAGSNSGVYQLTGSTTLSQNTLIYGLQIAPSANNQTMALVGFRLGGTGADSIIFDGTTYSGYQITGTVGSGFVGTAGQELIISTAGTNALTISAQLGNTTGVFDKAGVGTLILSGTNTYSGQTNVEVGTLQAGSNAGFSGSSTFNVTSSGVLSTGAFNPSVLYLSGSPGGTVDNGSANNQTLTIGANNTNSGPGFNGANASFSGIITDYITTSGGTGTLSIVKAGYGAQSFSNAYNAGNTYTGSTSVTSGILTGSFFADSGLASSIGAGTQINLGSYGQLATLQFSNGLTVNHETNRAITLATGGTGAAIFFSLKQEG